ncbi:MAG: arginine repressor [Lachnospiraceae bacterium]|nr:arginine repressor [Lachnospiraceae bacterium]
MKPDRKEMILEIINKYNISNQEELRAKLLDEGYDVTQGTVSKDMRALMLTKVQGNDGKLYYKAVSSAVDLSRKYQNILRDGFIRMTTSGNIIVVRTVAGMAMAVGAALDAMEIPGIAGCIAGDDTVFAAVCDGADVTKTIRSMEKLFEDTRNR